MITLPNLLFGLIAAGIILYSTYNIFNLDLELTKDIANVILFFTLMYRIDVDGKRIKALESRMHER